MKNVTTNDELEKIIKENTNVLVDLWAPWCGPCRMIAPIIEKIDTERKYITVVKVNTDEAEEVSKKYNIRSIPTVLKFIDGTLVETKVGVTTEDVYLDKFEDNKTDDGVIEEKIQAKGLNAPRITPKVIDDSIAKKEFYVLGGTLTVCVLTLTNGYTVTGESACASVENFNKEIGEDISYKNAKEKIWGLVGFLLVDALAKDENKIDFCTDNETVKDVCCNK